MKTKLEINSLETAYGLSIPAGDRVWVRFTSSTGQAADVCGMLAASRVDFTFVPEGIEYEITVRVEHQQILKDCIAKAGRY